MKTIAIIPARGGSKRLPNKNTLLLGGLPLLAHSINYAKENKIDTIVVSTDDASIKEIALQYGAEVLDRPATLATDTSPTIDTLKHVMENIAGNYDYVAVLQPTNPLRPKNLLQEAFKRMQEGNFDSLMTVTRNEQKFGKITNDKFEPYNYAIGQRSQDMEPLYFENGLLYIAKTALILEGKLIGENHLPFIVNHPYAKVDIDTQEDFDYAEYLFHKLFRVSTALDMTSFSNDDILTVTSSAVAVTSSLPVRQAGAVEKPMPRNIRQKNWPRLRAIGHC